MSRVYKMKTIDDGAMVRVHKTAESVSSRDVDANGRARIGAPIIEQGTPADSPAGSVGRMPFHDDVLSGRNPQRFVWDPVNQRPLMAECRVSAMSNVRNDKAQEAISARYRDAGMEIDATHLISCSMGGPGGIENLVPANEVVNREQIRQLEKQLEAAVKADPRRELFVQVYVEYAGGSPVPTGLNYTVSERKDGQMQQVAMSSPTEFYPWH